MCVVVCVIVRPSNVLLACWMFVDADNQACILLSFPLPVGGGKSKGLEMGKEIKVGKKRKKEKRKIWENTTFDSTKS